MTETADAVRTAERDCPECGEPVAEGGQYVTWCAACDWNVDPEVRDEEAPGRIERLRQRLAQQYGEQLLAELSEPDDGAAPGTAADRSEARPGTAGVLATALAVTIHGVTLALLAGGLWLVVAGRGALPLVGALLLGLAVVLRPRFGRLPKDESHRVLLRRTGAPRLFALLDEVAGTVGTTGVRTVVVDADVNASVTTYGIRQQRVLHIGLGLWEVLSPQERIALLGHEFGHYAHGDTRRSLLVGGAFQSLGTWRYTLAPVPAQGLADDLVNLATALPRLLVDGVLAFLEHLTLRQSQRAEYLADSTAARAGGTEAAAGLMDRLLIGRSVVGELRRESVAARTRIGGTDRREDPSEGLWERLAAHAASVPEREYERLRRVAERRGHQVDSTHPPTHLRHRRLTRGVPGGALIVLDAARAAEVDAELAEAKRSVARELVRG
ncbi:M48 family metalloprotease [Streptomyces vietnamensis]|uniref:Peptidase, M48 family protein n=1 Tax=Streptomyces vietnamensis TaxID=362257 RepID=A0A0B5I1D1_9ACTN|nr:M48 family metallopeptidase [Streptomyces vietnamensis]AJF64252.1 peptidase, M48 family protein [Streptomyces vietnamensis]